MVSVTVVTEVMVEVVVDELGGVVVVVTGAAVLVVVGVTVVVDASVGDTVTVWVVGAGAGASDCVRVGSDEGDAGEGDEVAEDVALVPDVLEASEPTNFTTAYTRRARIAAVSTPRAMSVAGFWCHGVRGGGGACGYPGASYSL